MTDPRVSPPPEQISLHEPARIVNPIVDLTRGPGGKRDRQLVFGDEVTILNRMENHCLIRSGKDNYCGTVITEATGAQTTPTHTVIARSTHAYAEPDIKSPDLFALPFGATVSCHAERSDFIQTDFGYVPKPHIRHIGEVSSDPADVAQIFLGTPYLWGGNSYAGIDCSGLIQASCLACGVPCPGDSDQQAEVLGDPLTEDCKLIRNDLIFWKGHVALVESKDSLLHATAGFMSVVREPLQQAIERIQSQGDGAPTLRKRLNLSAK